MTRQFTDTMIVTFSSKNRQYNMRKLTELPTALIGAERWQLFLESVCCIPFLEVSKSSFNKPFHCLLLGSGTGEERGRGRGGAWPEERKREGGCFQSNHHHHYHF